MPNEIVLRQIRPSAMFHVVGRGLMIVILRHAPPFDGKLIDAARANRRCGLAPQYNTLRQLREVLHILVRTVVEARDVQHGCHIVVHHRVGGIHPLCYGARRVFAMAYSLQLVGQFRTELPAPLVGNLIADTPHDNAGIIAEMMNQIHQILLHPFVKNFVIAVGDLRRLPFVERLGHHHHPHLVAKLDELRRRHIVRCPDGIAAHVLQYPYLSPDSCLVHGSPQRSQVVVVADTPQFHRFSVQEKAFAGDNLYRTDAEARTILVFQRPAFVNLRLRYI